MGRPQTWDEAELLGAAMDLFRRKGVGQTTVRDLEDATGLYPGSLYKAYGSKEGLFVAALGAYNDRVVAARVATYLGRDDDPLAGIVELFTSTFEARPTPDAGCLLTNTAIEAFTLAPAARERVLAGLALLERGLLAALERADQRGQLEVAPTPATAAQLLTLYQGLLVQVRLGTPRARLTAITTDGIRSIVRPAADPTAPAQPRKARRR